MQKMGLESWCLFSVFFQITSKISITLQKARVGDAYEKSEIPESFAKHHDAYKKIECILCVFLLKNTIRIFLNALVVEILLNAGVYYYYYEAQHFL